MQLVEQHVIGKSDPRYRAIYAAAFPRDAQRDANKQAEKENAEREGNRGYIDVNR